MTEHVRQEFCHVHPSSTMSNMQKGSGCESGPLIITVVAVIETTDGAGCDSTCGSATDGGATTSAADAGPGEVGAALSFASAAAAAAATFCSVNNAVSGSFCGG